jgi:hypothetical protein
VEVVHARCAGLDISKRADYFNRLHTDRAKKRAINQLEAMGYQVTLTNAS